MRRNLACLATAAFAVLASASAAQAQGPDPLGDLIAAVAQPFALLNNPLNWVLKATLYHAGHGMGAKDSLGCPVSPMRTVAVDPSIVSRHSIIFIKETAGMVLPDGSVHDGYWYASDIGGLIKGQRIDLYTGDGAASMRPMESLNLKGLTVLKVGDFSGCPPMDGGVGSRIASAAP